MVTALSAQLTRIRAQSNNPLDLKAQRKAHSQSLLFDPKVAVTQDFDSLYQVCFEGFEELCRLDPTFISFGSNVFSEQSKREDRTQWTAAQNQQLDDLLERFLSLVCSKLLLKPALKTVEWLVRRFRIHESCPICLVLTFLPYHATPIFSTLLSILPQNLPPVLRFLCPYIQSLTSPPRHAIVYSNSTNRSFFAAFASYVLNSSRLGFQCSSLISFWASVSTEAVAAMLDQSSSARRELQRQHQEDVVLFLLPFLSEGLSLEDAPNLKIGCYMVLLVVATKAELDDHVLKVMMEIIVSGWKQTSHAGLISLSALATKLDNVKLPWNVLKAVIDIEKVDNNLAVLSKQYQVNNLVLGVVLGIIEGLTKTQDVSSFRLLKDLMDAGLMDAASTTLASDAVATTARNASPNTNPNDVSENRLAGLILLFLDSPRIENLVRKTIIPAQLDLGEAAQIEGKVSEQVNDNPKVREVGMFRATEDLNALISCIPTRTAYEISFLSHSDSYVFGSLANVFISVYSSSKDLKEFSELPVLRKSLALSEPLFFSFFVRIWCGNWKANARDAAIRMVLDYLRKTSLAADVQILLPYIIYALGDPSANVRRAATDLVLVLTKAYSEVDILRATEAKLPALGRGQIYGQGDEAKKLSWLSMNETKDFLTKILSPNVEECLHDESHIFHTITDNLNGSEQNGVPRATRKDLKATLRISVFKFLCNHVISTPLYTVKFRLLQVLNRISKIGSTSRTEQLMPLLSECSRRPPSDYKEICEKEELHLPQLFRGIMGIVTPDNREGIKHLQALVESTNRPYSSVLKQAALQRIRTIWSYLGKDLQYLLATSLLRQAVSSPTETELQNEEVGAVGMAETLRALPLSSVILQSFLEALPPLPSSDRSQDELPALKRRRTSSCGPLNQPISTDPRGLILIINEITLVLELVDDAKAERHPELLKGLFQILFNLQHYQSHSSTVTDYLQVLTIDNVLAIVRNVDQPSNLYLDRAHIRVDVLVDFIRKSSSPQVRNRALLLVSALAPIAPDLILHNVMPIFTFMGTNILRQNDDFSAYVVEQTMESVIPRLVRSLQKEKAGASSGISQLLLSFAAAYEHIPNQRRAAVFTSLVKKVGPSEYLFALLAILQDKFPSNKKVLLFSANLVERYGVVTQLQTIGKYLEVIVDARKQKPTISAHILINDDNRTGEDTTESLLPLALSVLSSPTLISGLSQKLTEIGEEADIVRAFHKKLLERVFDISAQCETSEKTSSLCVRVLDASLHLLPGPHLVHVLESLLTHTEDRLPFQVLMSFEKRLVDNTLTDSNSQAACLAFLRRLVYIIEETEEISLKHIALSCIDKIIESFGKTNVQAVVDVVRCISGPRCLGSSDSSLRSVSLFCLTTTVEILNDMFIPIFPQTFPKAVENLEFSIMDDKKDAGLHNAAFSFIGTLLIFVPWMVTGVELDRLLKISYRSASADMGGMCLQSRSEVLMSIAKRIETKECILALDRTWTSAMAEGPLAVQEHLGAFQATINRQPQSMIARHSDILISLLLKSFDTRRIQLSPSIGYSYSTEEIEVIEKATNDCAISMIYKLNDTNFKPLFLRMMEWTISPDSKKDSQATIQRRTAWYGFLLKFFHTLKSIVTSYASFIIDDSTEILTHPFAQQEEYLYLWRRVLHTLCEAFMHDKDGFFQIPSHFVPLSKALLAQLAHAAQTSLLPEVIPVITELAVATDSGTHHKEMNATILMYMRSDSAAVRLAAVQCEQALTERLGEEWLALLPEMLPFISEALDDDEELVEREVQRWVVRIEGILGESLTPMLQ